VLALWRRVTRIGIGPDLPAENAKYVVVINAAAVMALAIVASYLPMLIPFEQATPYRVACLVQLPIWATPLWLNHRGRHLAARNFFAFACLLVFVGQVLVFGPVYGHQYFLLLIAVGPFLSYPAGEERWMLAAAAGGFVAYAGVSAANHWLEPIYPPVAMPAVLAPLADVPVKMGVFLALAALTFYARRSTLAAEEQVRIDREKSEQLLLNILPGEIAERLKRGERPLADGFENVTVLFADIAGFTPLSGRLTPGEVVEMLNQVFTKFDALAARLGLEKIKTIGDAYMVAGGLPTPRDDHAEAVAEMALGMVEAAHALRSPSGDPLRMRIGIHSGPVVAGVIGQRKFSYDLWGDTVNTASRMESHGEIGEIHVSAETRALLESRFRLERRGTIEVKGKGELETWFLRGRKAGG
jgi:class 3 adenylate cyclase